MHIENLGHYLLGIARNHCADIIKRQKREQTAFQSIEDEHISLRPNSADIQFAEQEQQLERMDKALASLTKDQRELVLAYYEEKASKTDLARKYGISVNALRVRVQRLRLELIKYMKSEA